MPESVLIVDDNEANRMVAEGNLVSAGYAVVTADSGNAALERFKEQAPDLVLLDIVMPGMNGFETCRALRSLPNGADVPIVFLTALSDLESHKQALEAGGDDLLTKPINRNELLLRARSMLWMRRLRIDLRSGYNLIRSQRDALMRSQQQREQLSSFIVHDLKSPLSVVVAYASLLNNSPVIAENPECLQLAQQIGTAAHLMDRMVMNLLDIKSSEDGRLTTKKTPVSVPELLETARKFVEPRYKMMGIQLVSSAAPDVKTVEADPDLLRRALDNLLANALRFSPKGSQTSIEAKLDGKMLQIMVRDQGPGIEKEFREKIFEKYVQLDPQLASHNQGLGLTFCRVAIEAHGGRIWVDENIPNGSVFNIQIPRTADGIIPAPSPAKA
jgi:signal transduction histidine kinase